MTMVTSLALRNFSQSRIYLPTLPLLSQRCSTLLGPQSSPSCQQVLLQRRQIRHYSTPTPSTTHEPPKIRDIRSQFAPESQQSPPPTGRKISLRPYIYASLFLLIGLASGQYVRFIIAPPPLPLPGTHDDKVLVEVLTKRAEALPLVKSLSSDPKWKSSKTYSDLSPEEQPVTMTTGAMGGARGLGGFQHVFYNQESGECISVIWFGGALAGWPGVTHGGAIATVMDERLGLCAINLFPSLQNGVTANLQLDYLRPSVTNQFYVIRAIPQEGATEKKIWVTGRLETVDGRVCVEAKALYVVPKNAIR